MNRLERIGADLQSRQKHHDPEIKLGMLDMVEDGFPAEHITSGLGITARTIQNWQNRHDESGLLAGNYICAMP